MIASSGEQTRFTKSFVSGISTGDIERGFLDGNERVFSDRVIDDSEGAGLSDSAMSSDACSAFKFPASHNLCTNSTEKCQEQTRIGVQEASSSLEQLHAPVDFTSSPHHLPTRLPKHVRIALHPRVLSVMVSTAAPMYNVVQKCESN